MVAALVGWLVPVGFFCIVLGMFLGARSEQQSDRAEASDSIYRARVLAEGRANQARTEQEAAA
jgi:uncharacterized membrane protein